MTMPTQPTTPPPGAKHINKTRNGGGFNLVPSVTINVNDRQADPNSHPSRNGQAPGNSQGKGTPGADFMSNEDIRAFSEHLRKEARNRAVERSMDAAQLEARLRNIPAADGRMSGARARARRVTRYLKLIAAGEKAIAKWATALYSAFEREYEAELIKIGRGRAQKATSQKFDWR